jgi:hypothetical protein
MPYAYSDLVLWSPETRSSQPDDDDVDGAPGRLVGAGRTLNHGLLLGALLGVPTARAEEIIADVDSLPSDVPRLFLENDLAEMIATYRGVHSRLGEAIDDEGRPVGGKGAALAASGRLAQDDQGRLFVRTGHVSLADLVADLARLSSFLEAAVASGLLVMKEGPGVDD